jgi:phosphoglycolate phosphatase-like HAD superfamily hydrolase
MWSAESGLLALDLDGTLIDARRRQLAVLASALAELRPAPGSIDPNRGPLATGGPDDETGLAEAGPGAIDFDALWERKREGATTRAALITLGVPEDEATAVAARWVERIEDEDELAGDRLLPGVEETLADLATRGVRPAVVTARAHPDRVRHQFATLGLDRWCDGPHVVDPSDAANQKAATLRELGAAAYVGDTESDARAASLAAIPFAAVSTGQRSPTFLTAQGLQPHPTLAAALDALST